MRALVVVENVRRWPFELGPDVEVVQARAYLTDRQYAERRRVAVYNLCRRYGYQSVGYYVSLLAAARGHRPLPSVATLQALQASPVVRLVSEELDELIQKGLQPLRSDAFELSIYFGKNVARRYDRLSRALFNQFPAPLLRARFSRDGERWRMLGIRPIATSEIPDAHREFVLEQATRYFARPRSAPARKEEARWEMAILWSEDAENVPSDERAVKRFVRAAHGLGIRAEVVTAEDFGRLGEYDALFIRENTAVTSHTFRFAQRAEAEGLVVIDHPDAIIRCSNKVYQAESFVRNGIPCPPTLVVHDGNVDEVEPTLGFPCVLKKPDTTFSQGVVKVDDADTLREALHGLLAESELVVAQGWVPSGFDWRIGVLDRRALYACKYHMARGHWQIIHEDGGGAAGRRFGKVEALPLDEAPGDVVEVAVRAASLIGDGLFGVDVKEVDGKALVIEVNDNPNVDAGYEDAVLGEALYDAVMGWFRERLDARGTPARKGS